MLLRGSFESAVGGTEAILAWSFRAGSYRYVPLAGGVAAAVIVGERTLSSGQPPRRTVLFVDEGGGGQRSRTAADLLRARFAALLGDVLSVRSVPIELALQGEVASLRIGDLVRVLIRKARLPQDAMQGARLWYDPLVPLEEATVAATLRMRYTGPEFNKRWEMSDAGTTGYYGRFRWPGE